MKCAASEEMARSASAKVRRFAGKPVTRCLLMGSSSASASGFRASIRRNNTSSVGDAAVWITESLRFLVRPSPPSFREIAGQRSGIWLFYHIPACDPLLLNTKHRNCVKPRHEDPVQRPHRRNKIRMLAPLQHGRDHCVDGRVPDAHVIARALEFGGLAPPIKRLLVSRRQRLVPAILDHVKIESKLALVELNGID